jgi:predicted Zn-dependent protease
MHCLFLPEILAGLLIALVFQGCAMNPVTGQPDFVLTTTEGERKIGEDAAQEVEQSMGLTQDPALAAYVEAIGKRLAQQSPRKDVEYQFYVVEMAEPNAFALPGGFVYVSRGLLTLSNSEDELAGVVGHEIGHVAARHSVRRMSAAAPFALVAGIAGGAVGLVSDSLGDAVATIPSLAGKAFLAPYSRQQEREADDVGVAIMAKAGWDPSGLSTFLQTLQRQEELQLGQSRQPDFFDSHPATPERMENTAAYAKKVVRAVARPIAADHAAFLDRLDGLVIGPHPAEGVFIESLFLQPDLDFALRFPSGWKTHNARQAVLAAKEDQSAFILIQVAAKGNDPMIVPRTLDKKAEGQILEKVERFTVGDLPAARIQTETRTKQGPAIVEITWIAHQERVYQITGVLLKDQFDQSHALLRSTIQSFRPMTASEHASMTITKLRIATAKDGETLQELLGRTGRTWSGEQAAVANSLQTNSRLHAAQLVKIARREPYGRSR